MLAGSDPPPPRFPEAVEAIERALIALDSEGVPREAQAAALLAALLPRLAVLHGPQAMAAVFGRLAAALAEQAARPGHA